MRTIKKVTREIEITTCDVCKRKEAVSICVGCKCDICTDCRLFVDVALWSGEIISSDYPDNLCESCYIKYEKYEGMIQEINDETDRQLDALETRWLKDCRKGVLNYDD